jgi:LuxR family maltose regulon positive regulatory protein
VRALIANAEPGHLAEAQALLDGCLSEVRPLHNIRLLIAVLALQALLEQVRGRRAEALATLGQAVTLAAPRGFVRTFVDLGPQVLGLLRALAAQGVAPTYLERVLTAGTISPGRSALPLPVAAPALAVGVLTRREVEVLALLAERWSNKEIAERLVITVNTVRRHTTTIYDKLGVGSRREAVAAARALGLLSQR